MGDVWVDANLLRPKSRHFLGRWLAMFPRNELISHTERTVQELYADQKIAFAPKLLANKFSAEFFPTLAEIEWAVFLSAEGCRVAMEPSAPHAGPDLRADSRRFSYYVEIRSIGPSEPQRTFATTSQHVCRQLKKCRSGYHVSFAPNMDYSADSKELNATIAVARRTLREFSRSSRPENATLYYFSPSDAELNIGGDIEWHPGSDFNIAEFQRYQRSQQAHVIVRFHDRRDTRDATTVAMFSTPRWDDSRSRMRQILKKKRTQLPKGERGILIIEGSHLAIPEASLMSALYGQYGSDGSVEAFPPVAQKSRSRAFVFAQSSRISAVVFYARYATPPDSPIQIRRVVYPTNSTSPGTIRLTCEELEMFGQIPEALRALALKNRQ